MDYKVALADYQVVQTLATANEVPQGVTQIKAPEFWEKGNYGKGVKIAIVDTGCDGDHPDLKERIVGGRNFTGDDGGNPESYQDYNGHGTHVAGTIAASQNQTGVVGVAPQADLLILKALDKSGRGSYESIIAAIRYAIAQKVDIIAMSLGGPEDVPSLHQIIQEAVAQNIIIVCAAANNGDGNALTPEYAYPAYYPEVVAVGAIDSNKSMARFSNTNDQIDLVAPGVNILSTYIGQGYATLSGTSMAAPHIAGALALLINWGKNVYGRSLVELELYTQLMRRTLSLNLPKAAEGNGMLYLTLLEKIEEFREQLNQ